MAGAPILRRFSCIEFPLLFFLIGGGEVTSKLSCRHVPGVDKGRPNFGSLH